MLFMSSGLHIIYKNIDLSNLHFDSKASILKVIFWAEYENNEQKYAPMVIEMAYFSKKNIWNHTNYGPYILEPDRYYSMLAEGNILLFSVDSEAMMSVVFEMANESMQSAGWDNALLIPEYFYRESI